LRRKRTSADTLSNDWCSDLASTTVGLLISNLRITWVHSIQIGKNPFKIRSVARGQAIFPLTFFPGFSKRVMIGLTEMIFPSEEMTWNPFIICQLVRWLLVKRGPN